MIKLSRHNIIILILFVIGIAAIAVYFFYTKNSRSLLLSCSFDAFVYDNSASTHLKKNTHLYYYSDGHGFETERGIVDKNSERYYVDRDVHFVYSDHDKDGTLTVKFTKLDKRAYDNAPPKVWGIESTPETRFYVSVSEIAPKLYLFRERGKPQIICTSATN